MGYIVTCNRCPRGSRADWLVAFDGRQKVSVSATSGHTQAEMVMRSPKFNANCIS